MNSGTQMILLVAWAFISYLKQCIFFAFKLFVFVGILWGFILSLTEFPSDGIALWLSDIQAEGLSLWGAKYFVWIASNWWQLLAILVFFNSVRTARAVSLIKQNSGHAAFVASSFEKYFDVEATNEKLNNFGAVLDNQH